MTVLDSDDTSGRLASIIVTYNSARTLPGLLASLEANTVGTRVIIVDNGSVDDSVAIAQRDPRPLVIATGANLGYSGGINIGRRHVRPDEHVAVLNPDLTVAPHALQRMLRAIDADKGIGIAVPQIRDALTGRRTDSLRREPTMRRALGEAVAGRRWRSRPAWLADTVRTEHHYARPCDVDWANGAALLISARCNRAVGPWDAATYFLYSEETDYASRARSAGLRVRYVPGAIVTHEGGASGRSAQLDALLSVNRVRYYAARHGAPATSTFRAIVMLQHLLRAHRPAERYALGMVRDRSRWALLPTGDPLPEQFAAGMPAAAAPAD